MFCKAFRPLPEATVFYFVKGVPTISARQALESAIWATTAAARA